VNKIFLLIFFLSICFNANSQNLNLIFKIIPDIDQFESLPGTGRLFLHFTKNKPECIISGISYPDLKMNPLFGCDINRWDGISELKIDSGFYGFPVKYIKDLPAGKYFVRALYDIRNISPYINEVGNYYSDFSEIEIKETNDVQSFEFILNKRIEKKPPLLDKEHYKFIQFQSQLLTDFWKQPVFLRAQVILPKNYYKDEEKKFPVLYLIGGINYRYYKNIVKEKVLFSADIPQMIIVFLDSKSPYGDSYQINSENNGPYGDAIVYEFIPYIDKMYRCIGKPYSRFLTGTSTGGWVSLALQIFYPDHFNGAWSTCSDPVDFRQMELINIYEDKNAFINRFGVERPAMRTNEGEIRYTLQTQIQSENALGYGNSFVNSGEQWGSWNAVFSPKDTITGLPMPLFNPYSGEINKTVSKAWEKYDLRLYLINHWDTIGYKLQGKLHIWMGTIDNYYLNNSMKLFDEYIKKTKNPKSDAKITFICGEGHGCDYNVPLKMIMNQMINRMEKSKE
jgi:hypothetical protein